MKIIFNNQYSAFNSQDGQALITFLFFVLIGVTIISSSAAVLLADTLSTTTTEVGQNAYYIAESGAEDGILKLLRNPSFTGTYNPLPTAEGTESIQIAFDSATNTDTITSIGRDINNNSTRTIEVKETYSNGKFTINSWKEK